MIYRVRMFGKDFNTKFLGKKPDGTYLMQALEHAGRCVAGTHIEVRPDEIIGEGQMPAPQAEKAH